MAAVRKEHPKFPIWVILTASPRTVISSRHIAISLFSNRGQTCLRFIIVLYVTSETWPRTLFVMWFRRDEQE